MWEESQMAALRKLWPGQQGVVQPELPIQGTLSHWNPVPAVLSHWRNSQGKYGLRKCHGGSSQAAAGLSVSSAPHGRSEQCISKATTVTDKTGRIGILGHK